jgi:hypothetical protein
VSNLPHWSTKTPQHLHSPALDPRAWARCSIEQRMGRSPVHGYQVRDGGTTSLLLYEEHVSTLGRTALRVPKNPDDMLTFVRMLLSVTHGELAALALTQIQPTTVIKDAQTTTE